jgi:FkbM family methyltransferase
MRRLKILWYWLFKIKNNINLIELLHFLFKPRVSIIANKYISQIVLKEFYEISFHNLKHILYWPAKFSPKGVEQVTAETFDDQDWHFYQKQGTVIETGEILLDVGSAEGLFPLTVIDKCKEAILIEPNPEFYSALLQTFSPFNKKIRLIHAAVGNTDGHINIEGESLTGQVSKYGSGTKVPICRIDSLIGLHQPITYLKADIEGFEYEMLRGAEQTIRKNKPKIAITTYHRENDSEKIIQLIKCFVPEYKHYVKGIYHEECKPVMIHFWI